MSLIPDDFEAKLVEQTPTRLSHGKLITRESLPVIEPTPLRQGNPLSFVMVSKSRATQRSYWSRYVQVCAIFGFEDPEQFPWHQLRYEHLRFIVQHLEQKGLAPSSINLTISAIRAVTKEAFNLKLMDSDAYMRIKNVPLVRGSRLPSGRSVAHGEIRALVAACEKDLNGPKINPAGYRDIAIIGLMYCCGLRREEVTLLRVGDIDLEEQSIRVIGKGNKERKVWADRGTTAALKDWLACRLFVQDDSPLLCPVRRGGHIVSRSMTSQATYDAVKRRQKAAGVRALTPHDFRRSMITELLGAGKDVLIVSKLAGHSDPKTTLRYDMRDEAQAQQAAGAMLLPYGD